MFVAFFVCFLIDLFACCCLPFALLGCLFCSLWFALLVCFLAFLFALLCLVAVVYDT
jgi:ABC-type transport system involved in cytochrome bd biosynthesis fused ATPase/permease subunit